MRFRIFQTLHRNNLPPLPRFIHISCSSPIPSHYPRELFRTVSSHSILSIPILTLTWKESTCAFDATMRRRVTSSLRHANSSRDNGTRRSITTRISRAIGKHCGTLPLLFALSIPRSFRRRRWWSALWVFFRRIYDTWRPRWHFHRTADPTMDHSTPLERANHSYANGLSRQVQGQPPPPKRWASLAVDSQTRHTYTYA